MTAHANENIMRFVFWLQRGSVQDFCRPAPLCKQNFLLKPSFRQPSEIEILESRSSADWELIPGASPTMHLTWVNTHLHINIWITGFLFSDLGGALLHTQGVQQPTSS